MWFDGVELIDDRDMVVKACRDAGDFEPESRRAWLAACRPGALALDVGAYTGLYALLAAKGGAMVLAYEPNPAVFGRLRANIARNGLAVAAFPVAVGDRPASAQLWMKHGTMTSAGRIASEGQGKPVNVRVTDITCAVLPVQHLPVTAIKVDVEGHELPALRGMEQIIQRDHPLVIAEALDQHHADQLVRHMAERGYAHRWADGRNLIFEHEGAGRD